MCKCGNEIILWRSQLWNNVVRNCGCKDKTHSDAIYYRHVRVIRRRSGKQHRFASGEYFSYVNMIRRCYGKTVKGEYVCANHGGKGIRVCDRWMEPQGQGFKNFLADMGPRGAGKTLDRVNPQDHYTPMNCVWGTKLEQTWHQTRHMWKDETPPPIPSIRDTNEQIDNMFESEPY